jgi:hypothetical protein
MPYANEAEYRAAVVAYRALHDVFYRFHKGVRAQHAEAGAAGPVEQTTSEVLRADERDYGTLTRELLPALAAVYAGPRQFVDRLAETLLELGARHAASRRAPFDSRVTHQAYVDVDNILQDLLRERERYPQAFDDVFSGSDPTAPGALGRWPGV